MNTLYTLYNPIIKKYYEKPDVRSLMYSVEASYNHKKNRWNSWVDYCDSNKPKILFKNESTLLGKIHELKNRIRNGYDSGHVIDIPKSRAKSIVDKYCIIQKISKAELDAQYEEYAYDEEFVHDIRAREMKNGLRCKVCGLIMSKKYNNVHTSVKVGRSNLCYICAEEAVKVFNSLVKPSFYDKMLESKFLHKFNKTDDET